MELDIYTSDPVLMHSELVLKKIPILSPPPPIEFCKNYPTSSEAQEQTMDPSGLLFSIATSDHFLRSLVINGYFWTLIVDIGNVSFLMRDIYSFKVHYGKYVALKFISYLVSF